MTALNQPFANFTMSLVPHAPNHDTRVVAICDNPIFKVSLPPLGKRLLPIIERRFSFPAVKDLIHHQNPQLIAKLVELGHLRVMSGSNCVATHVFE